MSAESSAFQQVMGLLSRLSAAELSTVAFHAQQLSVKQQQRGRGKPAVNAHGPAKRGQKKSKGPAMQVSRHAGNPVYDGYKAAERELHALLRKEDISLKDLQADEKRRDDPVLVRFEAARDRWFREKAEGQTKSAQQTSVAPENPEAPEKETKSA